MSGNGNKLSRRLFFEEVEDRRMLASYFVNDISDLAVQTGPNSGSLRWAIQRANSTSPGTDLHDQIFFSLTPQQLSAGISISTPYTISNPVQVIGPGANNEVTIKRVGLSSITDAFIINAENGGGSNPNGGAGFAFQDIILDGSGGFTDGIDVTQLPDAGSLLLNRVGLFNLAGDGIDISTNSNNVSITINSSAIASNPDHGIHLHDGGNATTSVLIYSSQILGNTDSGIYLDDFDASIDIQNNFIGTTSDGALQIGNNRGIWLNSSSSIAFSQITGNAIAASGSNGIFINGSNYPQLLISENKIGSDLNKNLDVDFANANGISLFNNSTIDKISQNTIASSDFDGIFISQSDGGQILNNTIVASGEEGIDVNIDADDWLIQNNVIGSSITSVLGNDGHGVRINANSSNNVVRNNTIGFNGLDGISITGTGSLANSLENNRYANNGGIPIDLGNDGVTINDEDDDDPGPNRLQNYAAFSSKSILRDGNNFSITVELDVDHFGSNLPESYVLEIYKFVDTGIGSGDYQFVSSGVISNLVALDGGIDATFDFLIPDALVSEGDRLATLLRGLTGVNAGNSSELSPLSVEVGVLAGDFDGDGDVDGADFFAWQRGFGMNSGATHADGDANGDGKVDADDLRYWADGFGINAPILADLDGSGDFGLNDLTLWGQSYGIDTGGDADADGDTDMMDFFAWQVEFARQNNDTDWINESLDIIQLIDEGSVLVVSSEIDEVDGDYSMGNLSLREAVILANAAMSPTTVVLPTGHYTLDRIGSELNDASYNDLDITGDVAVVGQGAGLSVIDSSGLASMSNQLYNRAFHVDGVGNRLLVDSVTLTGGANTSVNTGTAVMIEDGGVLELADSAVVNNSAYGSGVAIRSYGGDVTIRRSVFTNNVSTNNDAAVFATKRPGFDGSVTIGQSIFALNQAGNGTVTPNVWVANGVNKVSEGYNLYDEASGNFFNQVAQSTDYLGTTGYVVTTVEDTFDHANNVESLSVREAIDLANTDTGASEVWLPAWNFELTRDRGANIYDTDISYGDLDIKDSLTIRGIGGASGSATSIAWKSGIVDDIFDLIGDFDNDGQATQGVAGSDFITWQQQNGSGSQDSSNWGVYSADADDDGDVDGDDYSLWSQYYGNTLDLFDIAV